MSAVALLRAALWELRHGQNKLTDPVLTQANSGIQPDGHPPPLAPDVYVSLDGGESSNPADPAQDHIKERYTISVYVSRRLGTMPVDRRAELYVALRGGLEVVERQVKSCLHGKVSTLTAADGYLAEVNPGEPPQGFLEQLWWVRSSKPRIAGNDWSSEEDDSQRASGWLVQQIDFAGGLRVQDALAIH